MVRLLQREILDGLPHDDPAAVRSRRDLVWINALMGNWRWLARTLRRHVRDGDRVLELGAGRGEFLTWWSRHDPAVAARVARIGLDLAPRPAGLETSSGWVQADLLHHEAYHEYDVIIANLVLHHFPDPHLTELGRRWQHRPRVVLASEPARRGAHVWQARALACLGANRVTRHDAPASVRAGFRAQELPRWLGLEAPQWHIHVHTTWRGAYRLEARRTASSS